MTNQKYLLPLSVRARAPLRLGLAGGGTDVSPYCDQYGGYVLNATISRYAYANLTINPPHQSVHLCASDLQKEEVLPLDPSQWLEPSLALHRAVYVAIMENFNGGKYLPISLSTFSDAPAGSGLGSSSTLVVAMIRAFVEALNLPLDDYAVAQLAFKVERVDCQLQGGRQDQYSATFGGFNFMEFYADNRALINPLRIKNWILCELESSLLLFYTGVSRESAKIIAEQSHHMTIQDKTTIEAMHGLKQEALQMKENLLRGDFKGIVESMKQGWENKKRSSKSVSNTHIEDIYDTAIRAGALAGKASGAGGGGFMMFYVPSEKRMSVIRALEGFEGKVSRCQFTPHGSQAWRLA
jgi:D-glycero-alpha-D-manno-heptose-7-phosphate kinase